MQMSQHKQTKITSHQNTTKSFSVLANGNKKDQVLISRNLMQATIVCH